jgi:multiple sugar transport system substrate-binding protein
VNEYIVTRRQVLGPVTRRAATLLPLAAALGGVSGLGTACTTIPGQGKPVAPKAASMTYVYRGGPALGALADQFARQFVASVPGMQARGDELTGTTIEQMEKLQTMAAGGTPPDAAIHFDHSQIARLAATGGVLEALDPYLAKDASVNLKDIQPEVQAQYRFAKKTYGIAHGIALATLFYNQDLLRAAGVPPPPQDYGDKTWTAQAFLERVQRLTKREGDGSLAVAGTAIQGSAWDGTIGALIASNGGAFLDDLENPTRCLLEQKESLDVLQYLADLHLKQRAVPLAADLNGQTVGQWFNLGKVALFLGQSYQVNDFRQNAKFAWDVAALPFFTKQTVYLGGSGNALVAGGTAKDAAWELTKFMSGEAYQKAQFQTGGDTPCRMSVLNSPDFLNQAPPPQTRRVLAQSVSFGRAFNVRAPRAAEIEAAFALAPLLTGQVTASGFAQEAARKVAAILAQK